MIVTPPHCIITGEPITPDNNSRAHVIPSALGGRLKPWDILTKAANTLLGDKIDLPLIQAFQSVMTLIDGSRDRGANQPVRMTDESGRELILDFGEPLKLAKPEYSETPLANGGLTVHIDARNLKELRTLLGRVKAKFPDFDVDEALKHAVTARIWPDGLLHGHLEIGPGVVFPAVFVAASIFAAHHGLAPHPALRSFFNAFDPDNPDLPPDTFFFMPDHPWLIAPGEATHIVALRGDAASGKMLVCVRLFGIMTVAVVLPYAGTSDRLESYAIDVLTGSEVTANVDVPMLASIPWQATHQNGDPGLQRAVIAGIDKLLAVARDRMHKAEVAMLIERAFGPDETKRITGQDVGRLVAEIASFVLHEWERPLATIADRESDIVGFKALCAQLEKAVRPSERNAYRTVARSEQQRMDGALAQARQSGA
jgi:hypothetical protein